MMVKITIPNNNLNERKYIIDIIFTEFLGIEYELNDFSEKLEAYEIFVGNGNKLVIEDHFFNQFPNKLEYLKLENIPKKIDYVENEFTPENNIPVVYGHSLVKAGDSRLTCGIDIFASCFFMLTRWEEYVNKIRDKHERFITYQSLAYMHGFLDRPIVNEYVEMLWNMLKYLGVRQNRKKREYQLFLTHDVDHIYKWGTCANFIRHLAGDLIARKSIKEFFRSTIYYLQVKFKIKNDPYDTFDYLMDVSDSLGVKSYFNFMAEGISNYDNRYKTNDSCVLKLVSNIKKRGHYIGIHPTYKAYNKYDQFKHEKTELENNFHMPILFGREHYLRFEVPATWQIWEDNNMKWDSTLSYVDKEGFRCGVCYEYGVFNILTRKKLKLKEKPLIVMEGSVSTQNNMTSEKMELIINQMINKVKKYNGEFVFLWHNSSFNTKEWRKYRKVYERVLHV